MAKTELSDEDLAAMLAAEDQYAKQRKREGRAGGGTRDIFHAGFHFGVAHARGQTPTPLETSHKPDVEDSDGD